MAFALIPGVGFRPAGPSPDMRRDPVPEPPPPPPAEPGPRLDDEAVAEAVRLIDERAAARRLAGERRAFDARAAALRERLAALEAKHDEANRRIAAEIARRPSPATEVIRQAVAGGATG